MAFPKLCEIKMNFYRGTYELVDIFSSDEEGMIERASTPLLRCEILNYRVVLEIPLSPAEATVEQEECFELSLESLKADRKRMKLSLSYEFIRCGELSDVEDESIIVVKGQTAIEESVSSSRSLEFLELVDRENFSFFRA